MGRSSPFPRISSRTIQASANNAVCPQPFYPAAHSPGTGIRTDLSSRCPLGGTTGGTSSDSRKGRGPISPRNL